MSQEQVTIVQRFLDGFVAGDLETCVGLVHPEMVLNEGDSLPYPGDHHGRDGFQALVATMLGHFEVKLVDVQLLDAGSCVVGKILIEFTSRISGRTLAMPVVEFYDIRDGMLHRVDVYYKDAKAIADLAAGD